MRKHKQTLATFASRLQQRVPGRALLLGVAVAAVGVVGLRYSLAENPAPEAPPAAPAAMSAEEKARAQIIVKYKPAVSRSAANSSIARVQAEAVNDIQELDMQVLRVPDGKQQQALDRLNQDPNVEYAEPDAVGHDDATTPNDPEFSKQTALQKILVNQLWDKHQGSSDVLVAVLDGGMPDHEDVDPARFVPGHDFIEDDDIPNDERGHGTATTGIIAATANNSLGIAGVCWECRIMPLRISNENGKGNATDLVEAIHYAVDNGADILNISFGGDGEKLSVKDALEYAASKGVIVVASAGNDSDDQLHWPGGYEPAIGVAGTKLDDSLDPESNFGPYPDVAAPYTVYSLAFGGGYELQYGTSFSTPLVTGVIAVLKSAFPDASPAQLRNALTSTADPCCDGKINGGRANAIKAYEALEATEMVKPTVSVTAPAQGATVSGNFQIDVTAADASGIAGVELLKDGENLATDDEAPYSFTQDALQLPEGANTITVRATDTAGNSTDVELTFTVQSTTTPPPTTPPPGTNPKSPDINGDGTVNLTDLSILLSNWNKTTAEADLDSSGKVDLTDLSMLLSKWGTAG